jgi:urease accessory protein
MIKKVIEIKQDIVANDSVELSWFDMQKPHLCAVSNLGEEFIIKAKFTHLHVSDILLCEDGYTIEVKRSEDDVVVLEFTTPMEFAKAAYEIGNRHQPICIEEYKIIILDDISLSDIIVKLQKSLHVKVTKCKGYFHPNGNAHHSH